MIRRDTLDEPWHITPRGADLVASYEAAVEQGLEIAADDAEQDLDGQIDELLRGIEKRNLGPCPDCEFGRVSIPGLMSVEPVDPDHEVWMTMTCPTCKGAAVVEADSIRDVGRPLEGLGEILDGQRAALLAGTGAGLIPPGPTEACAGSSSHASTLGQTRTN